MAILSGVRKLEVEGVKGEGHPWYQEGTGFKDADDEQHTHPAQPSPAQEFRTS